MSNLIFSICSRISRAFLLTGSRQPHIQNNNPKKICSGTSDEIKLESKVDRESPGQLVHLLLKIHTLQVIEFLFQP